MAMKVSRLIGFGVPAAVALAAVLGVVYQRALTLGLLRGPIVNYHGHELKTISNTIACEDLHYDVKSDRLYTACQGDMDSRSRWFPPMLLFDYEYSNHQGHLTVISPTDFRSTTLEMLGFAGPFCPHGIDIYTDPAEPDFTYIFVINHMSNPAHYSSEPTSKDKALDRVEIFKHRVGERTAIHVRSVQHPLLRTTNDLVAVSSDSFYITNDHYYREGFMRGVEELGEYHSTAWSDISYVMFNGSKQPDLGVTATTALVGLHNNNGLGRGQLGELLINDASGGRMYRARIGSGSLHLIEGIQFDSALDNPFYYDDRYATVANNASGYILPGYPRAYTFFDEFKDPAKAIPALVWHVRLDKPGKRNHRVIFQDNGEVLRSASGAVLIGIDPKKNRGKKQGWLFVTGGTARACIALKVDL